MQKLYIPEPDLKLYRIYYHYRIHDVLCTLTDLYWLVRRARLLLPMPKPSTTLLLRLWSSLRFLPVSPTSCPNSAPITPSSTTAVVCFRFSSATDDGLRTHNSTPEIRTSWQTAQFALCQTVYSQIITWWITKAVEA